MYDTYSRIFTRLGLSFRAVAADTGAIGGTGSHEFHVLADSGEDAIAFCPDVGLRGQHRAGRGAARRAAARGSRGSRCTKVATPGVQHDRGRRGTPEDAAAADGQDAGMVARDGDGAPKICCCSCAATTC